MEYKFNVIKKVHISSETKDIDSEAFRLEFLDQDKIRKIVLTSPEEDDFKEFNNGDEVVITLNNTQTRLK